MSQGGRWGAPTGGFPEKPRPPPGQHRAPGGPAPRRLQVEKVADKSLQARLIYTNLCAVSPEDFPPNRDGSDLYILLRGGQPVGEYVVTAQPIRGFPQGCISLSDPQRTWCNISMRDQFSGEVYDPFSAGDKAYLGTLDVEVSFASPNRQTDKPFDEDELAKIFLATYQNQVIAPGQRILMDVKNIPLLILVKTVGLVDLSKVSSPDQSKQTFRDPSARGILIPQTRVFFQKDGKSNFQLKPSANKPNANAILAPDFKFEDMGIGGLSEEFSVIFRRAFASRIFPAGLVAKMGIQHVKGMLLYGPPGTGKTLIARQIGSMLNARTPKVINGPEVLNKFVGQSEENIRKLFIDAEKEYKEKGAESGLHIIIFDELDAVCKQRGSGAGGGTGVGDGIVNQLLSKLDGVDQLDNILLIGMTNRKDMIDDALLRPGRLEVHVEISLPDEAGRLEILKIHTNKMKSNNLLHPGVDLDELAGLTKNYSGAEISGLVKAAASMAFSRHTEVGQLAAVKQDVANIKVIRDDFMNGLTEIKPAFGVSETELDEAVRLGILIYADHVKANIDRIAHNVNLIRQDMNKFSNAVLLHGPMASGKTALAVHMALQSDYPFVRLITPANLAEYRDDFAKKDFLYKAFLDAYKSPASILILDDFEALIGWNPIGLRYSATILDTLKALIRSNPPKGHRLLVLATTSSMTDLGKLGVLPAFPKKFPVPAVSNLYELATALEESKHLDRSEAQAVCRKIEYQNQSDRVGLGIKTVLDCVFEAMSGQEDRRQIVESLADLLIENIEVEERPSELEPLALE